MTNREPVPLTAEETELVELWLKRPRPQRTLDQVAEYAGWVVAHRPDLLPKGRDDACEYLARLLADLVQEHPNAGTRENSAG